MFDIGTALPSALPALRIWHYDGSAAQAFKLASLTCLVGDGAAKVVPSEAAAW